MGTILLFDAGNTNTKICLADDAGLGESYTPPPRPGNTPDDWGIKIEAVS
jgi:type III pantothenate kinase